MDVKVLNGMTEEVEDFFRGELKEYRKEQFRAWELSGYQDDTIGNIGYGIGELFIDPDYDKPREFWKPDLVVPFHNLITDVGDLYIAGKIITAISPANASAPTAANGMKLGTGGATAVAKNSTGSWIATGGYITGSNIVFDATFPATVNLGAGLGVNAQYKTTWGAGVATATISEAAIVNDQATNAGHTDGTKTYSRVAFTGVPKGAPDTFAITWNHKSLGS